MSVIYHNLHTIEQFQNEHRFLSNFWPAKITYNETSWDTSEAAYQAMKSTDPEVHAHIASMRHAGQIKRLGKMLNIRPDWEFIKVQVMTDITFAKYDQNLDLKQLLLSTGFSKIEEGNDWGDVIWGVSPPGSGIGKNYLGVVLMKVREKYINELPFNANKTYTGIGSRETPDHILEDMELLANMAAGRGWRLRSGGALGADTAFEVGAVRGNGARQIYLPWPEFNNRYSMYTTPDPSAFEIATDVHPKWHLLPPATQCLVARNMHQILGDVKTAQQVAERSKCVVCWTPDGCERPEQYGPKTGGTGSAIFLAGALGIPVFNLKNPGRYDDAIDFMITNPNSAVVNI